MRIDESFINFCVSNFRYLRALDLIYSWLEALPNSIGTLKHLRYLDLSYCVNIRKLPFSFDNLRSLLTLRMKELEPEEEDEEDLSSLKTFSTGSAYALTDLPRLLLEGSSTTLQHLQSGLCAKLEVLPAWRQNLTSLYKLEISRCSRLSALPEGMDRLTRLRQLRIEGCPTLSQRYQRDGGADWHEIAHIQEVDIK
ncbi:hypothetical protein PTKIN_Ptkin01aG0371000 [Pterospermum kingtungense]